MNLPNILPTAEQAARQQAATGTAAPNPFPLGSHAALRFAVTVERLLGVMAETSE